MKRLAVLLLAVALAGGNAFASRRAGRFGYHRGCRHFMIGDGFLVSAADGSPYDAKTQFFARLKEKSPAAAPQVIHRPRRPWFSLR